jgi:hypothetical protein
MRISKRSYLVLAALLALGLTVYGAAQWADSRNNVTLPEGTQIRVALDYAVSSSQSRSGDAFEATVTKPVVLDGHTVIPAGAHAAGVLVDARQSGRLKGVARLSLRLTEVQVGSESYELATNTLRYGGRNHKRNNWTWIGGGSATGALIGGLVGGGKGLLIGGPAGAGAGVAMAAITGKRDIRLGAEHGLTFTLTEPATIEMNG